MINVQISKCENMQDSFVIYRLCCDIRITYRHKYINNRFNPHISRLRIFYTYVSITVKKLVYFSFPKLSGAILSNTLTIAIMKSEVRDV